MGEVVNLQGASGVNLAEDMAFVSDMCRYAENILTEKQVKKKWRFDAATWDRLGDDDNLVEKIEAESVRRIRDGSSKRERAQLLVVKAPDVVSKIMLDDSANPRHRIDAAASLDKLAANPAENSAAAAGFFQITINLGADSDGKPVIEHYEKSLVIDPNDGDLDAGRAVPQSSLPIVNKRWDDDPNDIVTAPARTGYTDHPACRPMDAHETGNSNSPAQLDLFAAPAKPLKTKAKKPDVYKTVRAMSAAERSALKSFLEMEE